MATRDPLPVPCSFATPPEQGEPSADPVYFRFDHFAVHDAVLEHGIFTRRGGVSSGPYHSLNTGRASGDDLATVNRNRQRIREVLAAPKTVYPRQNHGTQAAVFAAGETDLAACPEHPAAPADALMTDIPGLFLAIQVADCQPVLLFDSRHNAIANIHSGWRGSAHNIIGRTIAAMGRVFGTEPADIKAGIGPSLGPCCAEFIHHEKELPPSFLDYQVGRNHFDFWKISVDQMLSAGVRRDNIAVSGLCTRCRTDLFFSYRGEKRTGRFAALIGLKERRYKPEATP
jgi:YfiH family protein